MSVTQLLMPDTDSSSPSLDDEAAPSPTSVLLSPEVGIEDPANISVSSEGLELSHQRKDCRHSSRPAMGSTWTPYSESEGTSLSVVGASADVKFSLREMEEIYLARRARELTTEVGNQEEELGRHLTSCMKVINLLNVLHQELLSVRDRQALLSNGASRERAFEYEREMQQKITMFHSQTTLSESRSSHQPSISPLARKLRLIGHAFYTYPSFLSSSFNRLWNELWARA